MRRSAGMLTWSHYVYLTSKLKHWKDLKFKTYMLQKRREVHHFKHLYHSYNRIHRTGRLVGIFDNAANSSEGSAGRYPCNHAEMGCHNALCVLITLCSHLRSACTLLPHHGVRRVRMDSALRKSCRKVLMAV